MVKVLGTFSRDDNNNKRSGNRAYVIAVLAEQKTFEWVIVGSILCGYIRAMSVVNQNLAVSEYCHEHESKLPAALGLNMVTKGLVVLSVGQFLGNLMSLLCSVSTATWGTRSQNYIFSMGSVLFLHKNDSFKP